MKNKLSDLNDHLFAQLERLGEENITPEQLALELDRTKALAAISTQIVANARIVLDAQVAFSEHQITGDPIALLTKQS